MTFWHPLKLTSLCYIAVDASLMLGGVVYTDIWVAISGTSGMLGNWLLLAGGSGAAKITSPLLRRVAPYAERGSMSLYALQNIAIVISAIKGDIRSQLIGGVIGFSGCMAAMFWPKTVRLKPYQLAGYMWIVSSVLYIAGGVASGNMGMVGAGLFCILGSVFMALSRRAEFQPTESD